MSKNRRRIIILICLIIIIVLVAGGIRASNEKKRKFQELTAQVQGYSTTTPQRVNNAVITLPEENTIVGLQDGKGSYKLKNLNNEGVVTMKSDYLKTQFVEGIYNKKDPRQDAIAPMIVSGDSHSGSTYLILFNDRGDAAIEKSYAWIGGDDNIIIDSIKTLPADKKDEEYKVDLFYRKDNKPKELIIPVVDGHFKPDIDKSEAPTNSTTPSTPSTTPPKTAENNNPPVKPTTPSSPVMCTMEAKECPDGSFVGRSGPKCEFAICPSPQQSTSAVINQKIFSNGIYITPLEIVEDSRCPAGVSCVWAGRLRIKVKLERGGQTNEVMTDLGVNSVVFMGKKVTLVRATPTPRPADAVPSGDYRFEFSVTDKASQN